MNRAKDTACILLLISIPLLAAATQTADRGSSNKRMSPVAPEKRSLDPVRQKIVSLLDQVFEAQKTFADQTLRVVIQAHIADMLWAIDEPRARRLFEDALQESNRLAEQDAYTQPQGAAGFFYPARASVIRLLMPHDSNWATRLIESIGDLADTDPKSRTSPLYRERISLQRQLAIHFAQQDPQRAVQVMKPLVENGDLHNVVMVYGMIRSKDPAAANELFTQTLAKARLGQPRFEEVYRLASCVFPSFGEGVLRFSTEAEKSDPSSPVATNSAAVEQFLEFAYDVATRRLDAAMTAAGVGLDARSLYDFAIPKLLSNYFDRFMPDRAPAFRARLTESLRRVPPQQRPYLALTEPGTVQELLSRADAAAETRLKDLLYQRAITQASKNGDFGQTSEIIAKLSTEAGRVSAEKSMRLIMDQNRINDAWTALNREDLDKTEALLAEISDWYSQPMLLVNLVGRMYRKDKARATQILDEYERRAAGIEDRIERAVLLMALAGIAEGLDSGRGFQEMRLAIAEFNRAGFVPELERYRENDVSVARVNIGIGGLLANWHLNWLGRTDFDQAVDLTRQFQMKEASAIMQLVLCRGAVGKLPASPKPPAPPDETQRKALALLDQLLETSKSFEDAELKIRIQVQAADMLWERDQKRARRLFESAFQDIPSAKLPAQQKNLPPSYVGADSHYPLRNDVLRFVARRDPGLAAKLIDSVVDQPANVDPTFRGSAYGNYSEQDMLRFQFALYITRSDPRQAAQIATAFLQKGDIQRTVSIIGALRSDERSFADDLFAQTLSRVKQSNATSSGNIRTLAGYIFPRFGEGVVLLSSGSPSPSENVKTKPALTIQFLELAYDAVMQWPGLAEQKTGVASSRGGIDGPPDLTIARLLLPYFDEHMTDKAAKIRARVNAASNGGINDVDEVLELLRRAEKEADQKERDRVYWNASMGAMRRRDLDGASKILQKVSDERMRAQLELALQRAREDERYRKAQTALESGEFDTAYKLINELSEHNMRFGMLCNMALQLFYRKDDARGSEILKEAQQLSAKTADRFDRAQEAIRIAGIISRFDVERGFLEMKRAVDAINQAGIGPEWVKLENVTDASGRVIRRRYVGLQLLSSFLFDQSFSQLAGSDFNRALQLAREIKLKEASVLAQLGICRGGLTSRTSR